MRLLHGDCREVMASLKANSIDAIVTDPPYGLKFMGKDWDRFRLDDPGTSRNRGERAGSHGEAGPGGGDHPARGSSAVAYGGGKRPTTSRCTGCGKRDQFRNEHDCVEGASWRREIIDPHAAPPTSLAFGEWCRLWALEAYRVLKPGGHLAAFGGTRTYHRLASGIEDAGFELRDGLMWLYGSGFPKSHNLPDPWPGWGTALKPSYEPIVFARKPLAGTVLANMNRYGVGALNVDAARTPMSEEDRRRIEEMGGFGREGYKRAQGVALEGAVDGSLHDGRPGAYAHPGGRWPANVIVDEEAAAIIDAEAGMAGAAAPASGPTRSDPHAPNVFGARRGTDTPAPFYGDRGGPSRFFYNAKASRAEREAGVRAEPQVINTDTPPDKPGGNTGYAGAGTDGPRRNDHPTVKPVSLMAWLCRLITPPGGTVLDPFMGSGTTGMAALDGGFDFVGIELSDRYLEIARDRIEHRHLLRDEYQEPTPEQPEGRLL